jgi:hypothetical protein
MSEPRHVRPVPRSAAGRRRAGERLVALFVVGTVLLNFPLLSVVRGRGPIAGVPAVFVYLFLVWALLAIATALILRRRQAEPGGPAQEPGQRGG